jgi:toxin FitB
MIILDTNVLSELMRLSPAPQVMRWTRRYDGSLFATATVASEILYGIEQLAKGKRRDALLAAAESMFNQELKDRILPFDYEAAQRYAILAADRRRRGIPISGSDAQIAAVAQVHSAKLATRNVKDFAHCGIEIINPWSA